MESFREIFALVREYCRGELSDVAFSLWIKDIEPVKMDSSVATLYVRSEFKKNIIEEKYMDLLQQALEAVLGFGLDVKILCEPPGAAPTEKSHFSGLQGEALDFVSMGGDYEYTFANFIVGSSNKFAHAAALAVATNPSRSYNPLFIYGGSGLGKTHLLCAIHEEIMMSNKDAKLIYVKGEEFTNELILAITKESTRQFHDKYRSADILLVVYRR